MPYYSADLVDARVVADGNILSAAGVTAGLVGNPEIITKIRVARDSGGVDYFVRQTYQDLCDPIPSDSFRFAGNPGGITGRLGSKIWVRCVCSADSDEKGERLALWKVFLQTSGRSFVVEGIG
jgi:hypothetical protein